METKTQGQIQEYLDKQDVKDTVIAYLRAADMKDWEGCEAQFTKEVSLLHITETNPEVPRPKTEVAIAKEMIQQWETLFEKFASTLHTVTNFKVTFEGEVATSESYITALHVAKPALNAERHHLAFGTYKHTLVKEGEQWKINGVVYDQLYALGNSAIF